MVDKYLRTYFCMITYYVCFWQGLPFFYSRSLWPFFMVKQLMSKFGHLNYCTLQPWTTVLAGLHVSDQPFWTFCRPFCFLGPNDFSNLLLHPNPFSSNCPFVEQELARIILEQWFLIFFRSADHSYYKMVLTDPLIIQIVRIEGQIDVITYQAFTSDKWLQIKEQIQNMTFWCSF